MDVQSQDAKPHLDVASRTSTGKGVARRLRAAGQVPAVCYGFGQDPVTVAVDPSDIIGLFDTPRGKNILFDLSVDGDSIPNVMVKSYQVHPVRRELMHVDFLVVDLEEPVRVAVPIKTVGTARGVRQGGILNIVRPDIDIFARPSDIPDFIEIDVSELVTGQTIQAEDVTLPEQVDPAWKANYGLVRVVMPRKQAALLRGTEGEEAAPAEA